VNRRPVRALGAARGTRAGECVRSLARTWFCSTVCAIVGAVTSTVAGAAGWTTTLANGQAINIVEGSTSTRSGYFLERRYPDGARDSQFGTAGRVFFTMGSDNSPPSTLQVDAAGRILVVGATPGSDGRSAAAVLRFLPGGQVDPTWGLQGRAMAQTTSGDANAVDVLAAVDGSALVLGTIDDQPSQRAALWRFGASGQLDPGFGAAGALVATALPDSQGLSIQRGTDGVLTIAVQTGRDDKLWLEVFRWKPGDASPQRFARQEFPEDWVGPAVLTPRGASWVWLDASQPLTPPLELTTVAQAAPWGAGAGPAAAAAVTAPRAPESATPSGHAALNPFGQDAAPATGFAALTLDDLVWPGLLAAALLALGGAWWWWRRE
jgi:Domain of unknown function (DUF5122) beta-propeller